MLETIKFFLQQSPVLWASLGGTFFILGLLYSFAHWYRHAAALSAELSEQQVLLTESSDAKYRQEQRGLAAKSGKTENGVVYYPYEGEERRKSSADDSFDDADRQLRPQRRISDSPQPSLEGNPWSNLQPEKANV